jgi:hypothetical protein
MVFSILSYRDATFNEQFLKYRLHKKLLDGIRKCFVADNQLLFPLFKPGK